MLYQLSYASPSQPEKEPIPVRKPKKTIPAFRTDTLPLRTFNGTEIKVSTPPSREQTETAFFAPGKALS